MATAAASQPSAALPCHACITLQFAGGCELLFDKQHEMQLCNVVPRDSTLAQLVQLLRQRYIVERPELFVDAAGTSLRPGILVFVNGCDAEVLGGLDEYVLHDGDSVEFVSTLHGG